MNRELFCDLLMTCEFYIFFVYDIAQVKFALVFYFCNYSILLYLLKCVLDFDLLYNIEIIINPINKYKCIKINVCP